MKQLEQRFRVLVNRLRDGYFRRTTRRLQADLKQALQKCEAEIPVLIVSYNNASYVQSMTEQLNRYGIKPIVIDNRSTDRASIATLEKLHASEKAEVVFSEKNYGYLVGFINPVYELLPQYFAYSDPDLLLNEKLPDDFLVTMKRLTDTYRVFKAGFALEIREGLQSATITKQIGYPKMIRKTYDFREWEAQYWRFEIKHPTLKLYAARVDTTFAVYNKKYYFDEFYDGIRVGGDFSAIHLPWYPDLDIMSAEERRVYLQGNNSTTSIPDAKRP